MMLMGGLKIIISEEVPSILRFGPNSAVLTPKEAYDVALDSYEPKSDGPVVKLLEGYSRYMEDRCFSALR